MSKQVVTSKHGNIGTHDNANNHSSIGRLGSASKQYSNNSQCGGCRIFFDRGGTLSYNTKKGRSFKLSGVIFDLDGTLLDSLRMWHSVDQRILESF